MFLISTLQLHHFQYLENRLFHLVYPTSIIMHHVQIKCNCYCIKLLFKKTLKYNFQKKFKTIEINKKRHME